MSKFQINVLGTPYTVEVSNGSKDSRLKELNGLCDESTKEIVISDYSGSVNEMDKKYMLGVMQKTLRHELIHAFLYESGLGEESCWAINEEMVDWVARQGPKLNLAWTQGNYGLDRISRNRSEE